MLTGAAEELAAADELAGAAAELEAAALLLEAAAEDEALAVELAAALEDAALLDAAWFPPHPAKPKVAAKAAAITNMMILPFTIVTPFIAIALHGTWYDIAPR